MLTEKEIETIRYTYGGRKTHHSRKRKLDAKFKDKEKLKSLSYQKGADKFKKHQQKKGGWNHKIKGETCRSLVSANDRCPKSWQAVGQNYTSQHLKEGYKFSYIWSIT